MKKRTRKKYRHLVCNHLYHQNFMVTDDPYPMYDDEVYCKIKDWDDSDNPLKPHEDEREHFCKNCRHFKVSKKDMHYSHTCYKHIPQPSIQDIINQREEFEDFCDIFNFEL